MDNFSEKIKQLSEIEFPPGLHGKIMRKLAFLQFRTPFLVIVGFLTLNLIFSGWRIWSTVSGSEAVSTFKILLESLDWNWHSISDLFSIAQQLFPMGLIVSFLINAVLAGYLIFITGTYKSLLLKNKI